MKKIKKVTKKRKESRQSGKILRLVLFAIFLSTILISYFLSLKKESISDKSKAQTPSPPIQIPQIIFDHQNEAQRNSQVSVQHSTSAWVFLSNSALTELGDSQALKLAQYSDGIYSFHNLRDLDVTDMVFTKDGALYQSKHNNLWVTAADPNNPGRHFQTTFRIVSALQRKYFDPEKIKNMIEEMSGKKSRSSYLAQKVEANLEYQRNRLALYQRLENTSNGNVIRASVNTPVVIEWHVKPNEISRNPEYPTATVVSGKLDFKNVKYVYIPSDIDARVEQQLKANIKIFTGRNPNDIVQKLESWNLNSPIPLAYQTAYKIGQIVETFNTYAPVVGMFTVFFTPSAAGIIDRYDMLGSYKDALSAGETNLTEDEWYETHSTLSERLESINDPTMQIVQKLIMPEMMESPWTAVWLQPGMNQELSLEAKLVTPLYMSTPNGGYNNVNTGNTGDFPPILTNQKFEKWNIVYLRDPDRLAITRIQKDGTVSLPKTEFILNNSDLFLEMKCWDSGYKLGNTTIKLNMKYNIRYSNYLKDTNSSPLIWIKPEAYGEVKCNN